MSQNSELNDPESKTNGAGGLLPALLVAMFGLGLGAYATYAPPSRGEMAVVFLPGTDAKTVYLAIAAAGGRFVAPTRLENVAVAYAEDGDFYDRIRHFGGLLTLAAHGLCAPSVSRKGSI